MSWTTVQLDRERVVDEWTTDGCWDVSVESQPWSVTDSDSTSDRQTDNLVMAKAKAWLLLFRRRQESAGGWWEGRSWGGRTCGALRDNSGTSTGSEEVRKNGRASRSLCVTKKGERLHRANDEGADHGAIRKQSTCPAQCPGRGTCADSEASLRSDSGGPCSLPSGEAGT